MPEGENAVEHKKIILFGGTFDPPHNGHMTLLSGAIETVQPDLVIVEPAGTPPHKRAGETAARHRAAMCECFCPLCGHLIIDDTEIRRAGKSYTVDTVRAMNERYPGAQLYFPMGSDMLLWFRNWVGYKELLRRLVIVAHVRAGEDEAPMRAFADTLRAEGGSVLFVKCVRRADRRAGAAKRCGLYCGARPVPAAGRRGKGQNALRRGPRAAGRIRFCASA